MTNACDELFFHVLILVLVSNQSLIRPLFEFSQNPFLSLVSNQSFDQSLIRPLSEFFAYDELEFYTFDRTPNSTEVRAPKTNDPHPHS